ncbi:MAG: UDP-N-acetylmuramoyl-L-alanine--D-glutamate ligase, partial [Desulfobacteraceae bacterium]|nr:UDP-N-acetylmuramoyl-L-alanine--D-glutamate ligase [Desulfobacteraceae bacterium]
SGISTFTGGNIGTPLVEYPMAEQKADMVVAEISSFQLDLASNFKPDYALLLNVAEDHLDRYNGFEGYVESKWSIFKNQTSRDNAIINQTIDNFETRISRIASRVFSFSSQPDSETIKKNGPVKGQIKDRVNARIFEGDILIQTKEGLENIPTQTLTQLPGIHNRENIAAAALVTLLAGGNLEGIMEGLKNFKNLPHRMAFIREIKGISFYDDSKATNTDAVVRALESFKKNIILILGGREKGTDFSLLAPQIKDKTQTRVKQIIAIGEARSNIQDTLGKICPVLQVESMEKAVKKSYENACPGDVVLLSPACASFDMYENYGARGDDFISLVRELENG